VDAEIQFPFDEIPELSKGSLFSQK